MYTGSKISANLPVIEETAHHLTVRLFNSVSLFVLLGCVLYSLVSFGIGHHPTSVFIFCACVILFLAACQVLKRGGHLRAASALLTGMIWSVITVVVVFSGGIVSSGFTAYASVILVGGILLGWQSGFILTGISALVGAGILFAEANQLLPKPIFLSTQLSFWIAQVIQFGLAAALLHLSVTRLREVLESAQREINRRKRVEQAFRQSERYFKSVTENIEDGIVVVGDDFTIRYLSPSMERMLGHPLTEMMGKPALGRIHPDDHGRLTELFQLTATYPKIVQTSTFRALHKDGSWRTLEAIGVNRLEDPMVAGIIVTIRDITDRKRMEDALCASENRFREMADLLPQVVFELDLQGRIMFSNRAGFEIFGYSQEDFERELSALDMLAPQDRERAQANIARSMSGACLGGQEYRALRKDGSTFDALIFSSPIKQDDKTVGLRGILIDVSELKKTEQALRQSEELFRNIFKNAPIGMVVVGLDERLLQVNQAMCDILGYTAQELLGKTISSLSCPEDCHTRVGLQDQLADQPSSSFQVEKHFVHKDGRRIWSQLSVTLVRNELGDPLYYLGQVEDITTRKTAADTLRESEQRYRKLYAAAERQAQELALLDRVRTALARELDPPTVIKTVVEAIADTFGYTLVSLYLLQGDTLVLQHQVGYQHQIDEIDINQGISGRVVRTGKPVFLEDVHSDPAFIGAIDHIVSEICVPLIDNDQVLGVLNVESTYGVKLTYEDLHLVMALSEHIVLAIVRARLYTKARESEQRFRALIENSSDAILVLDAQGIVNYASSSSSRNIGYADEEFLGQNPFELIHPDHRQFAYETFTRILNQPGASETIEFRFKHRDGHWIWIEATGTNLIDDPAVKGVVVNYRDTTQRQRSEERFRRMAEQSPDIIFRLGKEGMEYVSPACIHLTGYSSEEFYADPGLSQAIIHPEDRGNYQHTLENMNSKPVRVELRILHKDGSLVWAEQNLVPILDEAGQHVAIEGITRDISERKQTEEALRKSMQELIQEIAERRRIEQALRESEERYALAAQGANDGLWDWDLTTDSVYFSPRWREILGQEGNSHAHRLEEWISRIHPEDVDKFRVAITAHLEGLFRHFENEHRILHSDGTYRWVLSRGLAVRDSDGVATRMAGSLTDITDRKKAEEQLLYHALNDPLTDLPNRALFNNRLEHAIRLRQRREDYHYAVIFLDIDRFKIVNDSKGHSSGDQLLMAIAQRLKNCLRTSDTCARMGGDEFVLLVEDLQSLNDAIYVAHRIQEQLAQPFNLNGTEVIITASMGIVPGDIGYECPEEVLRDADIAMYRAKAGGRARYEVFNPEMRRAAINRLELETELRRALDQQELRVVYQPIVTLVDGKVTGFEALVRWQHPERGVILPNDFIPVAEESSLIIPIDRWVMQEACRQMRAWIDQYPETASLTVNVNLSSKQFNRPDLLEQIKNLLERSALEPRHLRVEITEGVIMEDITFAIDMLEQLHAIGVQVEIDDFGTGYSSLSYLIKLPVDTLKIDRSFVSQIDVDKNKSEIIRTIVNLARNLGMNVIAEGIETEEQRMRLLELGCEQGQGFLFSRPLEREAIEAALVAIPV